MSGSRLVAGVVALAALVGSAGAPAQSGRLPVGSEPVKLDPAHFTTRIDNPWFPLTPGDRRVYRVTDADGLKERSVVTVTGETKLIANGITAQVVHSVVSEQGRRIEDNRAWYAQDRPGNVWYLGEAARKFENGKVTTTKGSWEAGVGGAQPGVIMPARPQPGLRYREEYAKGIAEDRGEVFSRRERAEVPFRSFRRALLIRETEGIEPTLLDYKFYARRVGPVLGIEISGGSGREELVRFRPGQP